MLLLSAFFHFILFLFLFQFHWKARIIEPPFHEIVVGIEIASPSLTWSFPENTLPAGNGGQSGIAVRKERGIEGIPPAGSQGKAKPWVVPREVKGIPEAVSEGETTAVAPPTGMTVDAGKVGIFFKAGAIPDAAYTVKHLYRPGIWKTPSGGAGGISGSAFSGRRAPKPDLSLWARRAILRIQENWDLPPGYTRAGTVAMTIRLIVGKNGHIKDIGIISPSDIAVFQEQALAAVKMSDPLPPLPAGFDGETIDLELVFVTADEKN